METDNDATVIDYTSALNDLAALTTAHADWGLKEISSTLAPGLYRLDIADALFASGAWTAVVYVMVTSSAAAASPMEFVIVTHDPNDLGTKQSGDSYARIGVNGAGLTAIDLPNQTMDITGNITGNLSGSVGSVSGAVGSVTGAVGSVIGNVGGNVAGTVASVVGAVGSVTGNVGGNVTGSVGSVAAGGIAAASFAANAKNASKLDPDVTTELQAGLATQVSVDDLPTNAELATALGTADDAVLTAIGDLPTNAELATALDALPTAAENADKLLGRNLAGGADGTRTVQDALRSLRNKVSISAGTLTVTEEDDTTTAWTAAVTTAAGNPLSAIDPA
jgi:hypothetical protein